MDTCENPTTLINVSRDAVALYHPDSKDENGLLEPAEIVSGNHQTVTVFIQGRFIGNSPLVAIALRMIGDAAALLKEADKTPGPIQTYFVEGYNPPFLPQEPVDDKKVL